jgi:hypothetical protein
VFAAEQCHEQYCVPSFRFGFLSRFIWVNLGIILGGCSLRGKSLYVALLFRGQLISTLLYLPSSADIRGDERWEAKIRPLGALLPHPNPSPFVAGGPPSVFGAIITAIESPYSEARRSTRKVV